MKDKKWQKIGVGILGLVTIVAFGFMLRLGNQNDILARELNSLTENEEKTYSQPLFPEEVIAYEQYFEDEIETFLSADYDDDYFSDIGYQSLENMFSVIGTFDLSENPSTEELREFYEPFDYTFENVTAYHTYTADRRIISLIGDFTAYYNEGEQQYGFHVLRADLDEDGKIIGGGFYGEK